MSFNEGHVVILYETHEHGNVFFYIMPSNKGHQRAASHPVHEHLVIVIEELCPCALVWSGLPNRLWRAWL